MDRLVGKSENTPNSHSLVVEGPTILDNFWKRPLEDLMPPVYLWVKRGGVVHLADPNTFRILEDSADEDGTYQVDVGLGGTLNLRCYNQYWVCDGGKPRASRAMPPIRRICKKCLKVVAAILFNFVNGCMVGVVTRHVKAQGIELGYYQCGDAWTSDIRPRHGRKPGSLLFMFKSRTHGDEELQKIAIPLLDIENWTWFWDNMPSTADEIGTLIGTEIIEYLKRVDQQVRKQMADDEDFMFSDL